MVSDFDCITGPIKARIHGVYTVKTRARLTFSNEVQMTNRVQLIEACKELIQSIWSLQCQEFLSCGTVINLVKDRYNMMHVRLQKFATQDHDRFQSSIGFYSE